MSLPASLSCHTVHFPEALQALADRFWLELEAKITPEQLKVLLREPLSGSVLKVCCCSRFISENVLRNPQILIELAESGDLFSATRSADYATTLQQLPCDSEANLARELRLFRRREMLRIAWRDLAGWADLDETLMDLSLLAEACITCALDFLYRQACQRWGTPKLADGAPFNMLVLGMGKLGAWELNFSSDIDLIFAYAEDGLLTEKKEITYGEFFNRICRSLIKMLDEITVDGFVFRTDTRLRPFGDSGPLIMNFDGMENYYQTQAREWERYAMIKARQVAGDETSGKQLAAMIKPFVYRRYLDYGAFEELRSLKFQIMQELKRKDRMENVKLGPGGIREIEFIGQAFQLIRGGQTPALQQREIQVVLEVLNELRLMSAEDAAVLKSAYRFLRRVENHIQQYQDKQTHELPSDPVVQQILAFSLDFADWQSFKQALDEVRDNVHAIFNEIFSLSEQANAIPNKQLIWAGDSHDEQAQEILYEYGYQDPAGILTTITEFKNTLAVKRLTAKGLGVMQRLVPKLVKGLTAVDNREATLKRILDLFAAVAGRNVYLSLLAENPDALTQLITLAAASPWICQYLAQYPLLFDELLDVRSLYEPLEKAALKDQLAVILEKIETQDSEQLMNALRQFKHLNLLRVAAADIMGVIPVMVVSDYLTWIAEAIVEQVLNRAWRILTEIHGVPPGTHTDEKNFAIIALGKFGGIELGYGSDLDLVFVYNCPDDNALTDNGAKPISCGQFYLRLGQKIRHIMDTKMLSGILYEVDLRLRPNGDSGLLVSHIDYYADYLEKHAWTWEHQALVRARFICGDNSLNIRFAEIRKAVLCMPRDYQLLKTQVSEMREKMRTQLTSKQAGVFDLKQSRGGIADIEFIVQFGILAESAKNPALTTYTDNVRLLAALQHHGFINSADAAMLKQAYCAYRDYGHHQILQGQTLISENDEFIGLRAEVERIWLLFLE